jgi:hypothetical protein
MSTKREKKALDCPTLASVKKEMAKPRMAKSARIAELGTMQADRVRMRNAFECDGHHVRVPMPVRVGA